MKKTIIISITLLLLTLLPTNTVTSQAPSITYITLPSDSLPMGIIYDNNTNVVWVALYWNRSIAKINVTTKEYKLCQLPDAVTVPYLQIVTLSGKRIILNAIEDARVREACPNTNYGNDAYLSVLRFGVSERSFLKFDISSISKDITSATLNLYVKEFGNTVNRTYEVNKVIEDWGESSITWNNQPNITTEFQVNVSAPTNIGWFSIDVTPIVNSALELNETTVSFRIKDSDETGCPCTYTYFCSKEDVSVYKGPMPWTLALAPDGDLWISIRSYMVTPNHPLSSIPYLAKMNTTTGKLTILWIPTWLGGGCDIKYLNGFIWYLTNQGLAKINYTISEIVECYPVDIAGGFMEVDGDSIWISSVSNNVVKRFNTIAENFDVNLTGFDRPLGIEVDSKYVYVAENHRREPEGPIINGTIARIDKATYSINRIVTNTLVTNEGPYHVLKDGDGNLWWTTNSKQIGGRMAFTESMFSYEAISPYCYFMVEVPSNGIWFSCVGSAYVGIVYPPYNSPDINKDGTVDSSDLGILGIAWGSISGDPNYTSDADLNRDSIIDSVDLGMIGTCWGMAK
jgi:streptogramin lyase